MAIRPPSSSTMFRPSPSWCKFNRLIHRKLDLVAFPLIVAQPVDRSPGGMIAAVDILVCHIAPTAVRILVRKQVIHPLPYHRVVVLQAERLERVQEFAYRLRIFRSNGLFD